MIKEDIKQLEDVLIKKIQLEKECESLPKEKEKQEMVVNKIKENFVNYSDTLRRKKEELSSDKIELQDLLELRKKNENDSLKSTTQKEFDLFSKQIKTIQEKEQELTLKTKRIKQEIEKIQEDYENTESMLAEEEDSLKTLSQDLDLKIRNIKSQIEKLKKEEYILIENDVFPQDFVIKFDRIIKSKGGEGMALLHSGVCTGCNMILSIKFLNQLKQADEKTPNFCPYCSRVIFYDPYGKDDEYLNFEFEEDESVAEEESIGIIEDDMDDFDGDFDGDFEDEKSDDDDFNDFEDE